MNRNFKIVAYVVLTAAVAWFGYGLFHSLSHAERRDPGEESTNAPAALVTNTVASTNAVATNAVATNLPAATNFPAATNAASVPPEPRSNGRANWMGYFAGLLGTVLVLALLAAYDLTRFFANRVDQFVFNDDLQGVKDPEYDEAEQAWAAGRHLEAIQLMRDYLQRHPLEQYVALRIAEIYEKDLGNHLAAALEYEEVLKKKLEAERWGWAAIHLANLYSGKLNKPEPAEAWLHRIVNEYGQTAAAKKARERLGLPEPVLEVAPAPPPPEPEEPPPPAPPPSNLPPGFRPK